MSAKERERLEKADAEKNHEAATAKLWAVYVSEAEKYDKGLVESWKNDMEGMLIFAGLFSASLTAFLIESYKTLISPQCRLPTDPRDPAYAPAKR
ncbi:hypothetical protein FB451DRAFT_1228512 [Mycena latifolia]|nr:hypothetical protein FB451DRAFT_1228512 [Mycena latifolia]